jgi:hypothetical protein
MVELKDPDSPNPSTERHMSRRAQGGQPKASASDATHEQGSRPGKSLNNTQTTVVMVKELFQIIVDEQIATRELNRNKLLRQLLVEALRVRRKKRGLETPDSLTEA